MAGRHRRKVSNSTVATVDTSQTKWLKESDIVKPMEEEIRAFSSSNKWPCYVLTDATVYLKDGKRPANPLLPNQPWVVRGRLEVDPKEQRDMLLDPNVTSGYIEIPTSTSYSISWGPLAVWVSGERGWYEIGSPSPQFAQIYTQMREAITLYYELLEVFEDLNADLEDYYAAPKNKRKRMQIPTVSLDDVLLKYAVAVGDGMFRDEAEERCHKWAPFLINHFPKESDIEWKGTFFYTWLIDKHPAVYRDHVKRTADEAKRVAEDAKRLQAMAPSKPTPPVSKSPPVSKEKPFSRASSVKSRVRSNRSGSRKPSVDTDIDMADVSQAPTLPPTRMSSAELRSSSVSTPQFPPPRMVHATPQAVVSVSTVERRQSKPAEGRTSPLEILLEAVELVAVDHKAFPARTTEKTVSSRIYPRYSISPYAAVLEIVAYYSRELVQRLDPKWHATDFWTWLLNESKKSRIELRTMTEEDIAKKLVLRARKIEPATPTAPGDSLPQKLEFRAKPRPPSDDEGIDSDGDDGFADRRRHAGKGGLRLQSASKKRTATDMLDDDEESSSGRRGRKAAKSTNYFKIPNYIPDLDRESASDNDADAATSSEHDTEEEDPDGLLFSAPKDAVRVVVHAQKLPSMSPSGPNGTWVCDQEGCGYVVRAAEEAAGRAQVQQHFHDHEARTQKVALARTEAERRGRMPINHLLEKIQKLGKDNLLKGREVINGEEVPAPIKRRLVV